MDVKSGALWTLANFAVRFLLFAVLAAAVPAHVLHAGSNTANLHHAGTLGLALFGVGAVLVAPVAEETPFRGVLLRAGMRRWTFARSALLTSLIFGAFHSYEAASVAGAAVLILNTAAFGFVQCLAARRSRCLVPCAIAHAIMNGLALLLVLTT
jgi:membrane protease YdiL (CAAX protease family)